MGAYSRRNFLINPRFQLRWTIIITLISGIIASVFAAVLWVSLNEHNALLSSGIEADQGLRSATEDISVLLLNMPETTADEAKELRKRFAYASTTTESSIEVKTDMIQRNLRTRYYLVAFVCFIVMALFFWGIFVTHRIAGPMYVIKKQLTSYRTGGTIETRPLRHGDEFQDVYDELCNTLGKKA